MATLFAVIVLVFSAILHEISHGFVAEKLGDPTARLAGRLTLNPLKHLDPFGSVILPLLLSLLPGGIIFGWAKPVPYNPFNLKNPEKGAALIALAGPASNLLIAAVLSVVYRLIPFVAAGNQALLITGDLISAVVLINIVLGIFNLVPIPPLDGAKVILPLIPDRAGNFKRFFYDQNQYGWLLLIVFVFIGLPLISPVILGLYHLLIGA